MNYLAFKIYLSKCLRVNSNGDISVLDNCLIGVIKYIFIYDI
jgi:hypothetical protein